MTKIYRSRSGQITAIDTKTQLTTLGSESAPGKLDVPQKAKDLGAIFAVVSSDMASAEGKTTLLCRLEGPGLPNGPETIAVGGMGQFVVTGTNMRVLAKRIPLGKGGISVTKGEEIQIFGEALNEDGGAYEMAITLEFDA